MQKLYSLVNPHLPNFWFISLDFEVFPCKLLAVFNSLKHFPWIFLLGISYWLVLNFTFKYFWFIFITGMRQGCSFIVLHTDGQLPQKGLLSGLPFPKLSLGAFAESQEEGSTPDSLFCFIASYQFWMSWLPCCFEPQNFAAHSRVWQ